MNSFVIPPKSSYEVSASQKRAVPQSGPAMSPAPSHEDIARRAYEIYVKKGRQQGQCQQDWLQAERELRKQTVTASTPQTIAAPPAARAGSGPVVKTAAGASPSIMGSKGSTRGGTPPVPPGGRGAKA